MSSNHGRYNADPYQPQIEGEADDNIDNEQPPPPAFNPEALNGQLYMPAMQSQTYGAIAYPPPFEPGYAVPSQPQYPMQEALQPSSSRVQFQAPSAAYNVAPPQNLIEPPPLKPKQALLASSVRGDYRHPARSDKRKRCVAAMGAIASVVLLIIAVNVHQLARGNAYGSEVECTIDRVRVTGNTGNGPSELNDAYYEKYCYDHDDDDDDQIFEVSDWCDTFRGAMIWIGCVVLAAMFICCGTCFVQPMCTVQRCCCPNACPRVIFALAMILTILANVEWIVNDKVCLEESALHLHIGKSVNLVSACCVLLFLVICCAK